MTLIFDPGSQVSLLQEQWMGGKRAHNDGLHVGGAVSGAVAKIESEGYMMYPFNDIIAYGGKDINFNIVSDADVKADWLIERIYGPGVDCFQLSRKANSDISVRFDCIDGQFMINIGELGKQKRCLFNASYYHRLGVTKSMIQRMVLVERFHTALGCMSLDYLVETVQENVWKNCPITVKDINMYRQYMHDRSCIACKAGKTSRPDQVRIQYPIISTQVGLKVSCDLLYLTYQKKIGDKFKEISKPILLGVDSYSLFKCGFWLSNRSFEALWDALVLMIATYRQNGHEIKCITIDHEGAAVGELGNALLKIGIKLELSSPGRHTVLAEICIKYLKTMWRATICSVEYNVLCPKLFYRHAFMHCVQISNMMVTSENSKQSPHRLFFGLNPDFGKYARWRWGTVVASYSIKPSKKDADSRVDFGVFMGFSGHNDESVVLFDLETKSYVDRPVISCKEIECSDRINKLIAGVDRVGDDNCHNEPKLFIYEVLDNNEVKDEVDEEGLKFEEIEANNILERESDKDEQYYIQVNNERIPSVITHSNVEVEESLVDKYTETVNRDSSYASSSQLNADHILFDISSDTESDTKDENLCKYR